jgi:hypothetical protein
MLNERLDQLRRSAKMCPPSASGETSGETSAEALAATASIREQTDALIVHEQELLVRRAARSELGSSGPSSRNTRKLRTVRRWCSGTSNPVRCRMARSHSNPGLPPTQVSRCLGGSV